MDLLELYKSLPVDARDDGLREFFAPQSLDASKGTLFGNAGTLQPNTDNRTIFIGLGGTGVQTVNDIMGAVTKRLAPTWHQYVGCMGIDSDGDEIARCVYLPMANCVNITENKVNERYDSVASWTPPARRFTPQLAGRPAVNLAALDSKGAGRKRLAGKFKLHDKGAGEALGVDEKIVSMLQRILVTLSPLSGATSFYEVYVIGSVCGGTCSGCFTELPALIRKAVGNAQLHINAMLYLPDTLTGLDPGHANEMKANGYAALKELNYYQSLHMRDGYTEFWGYNNVGANPLSLTSRGEFFSIPYLIGASAPNAANASRIAREIISEYLVSIVGDMKPTAGVNTFSVASFLSNARAAENARQASPANPDLPPVGEDHTFPMRFGAIGFASAGAPQMRVRAYTVKELCARARFRSAPNSARDGLPADAIMPFRSKDALMNAVQGTQSAAALLAPLADFMTFMNRSDFSIQEDHGISQAEITWQTISNGEHDGLAQASENAVKRKIDAMSIEVDNKINMAYAAFEKNVQAFVREHGPFAFWNLYYGRFTPVNGDHGTGAFRMLQNLTLGSELDGATPAWTPVDTARKNLKEQRDQVNRERRYFLSPGKVHARDEKAREWVRRYDTLYSAMVIEKRRAYALGVEGKLQELFIRRAARLTEELEVFGTTLDALSDIYTSFGKPMDTFETFADARDNHAEVNIAAVNPASWTWLKNQADTQVATVNARALRDGLVDDFFANRRSWLEIPDGRIRDDATGRKSLTSTELAVPAREQFDKLLAVHASAGVKTTILDLVNNLNANGQSYTAIAAAYLNQLMLSGQLQLQGTVDAANTMKYLVYPSALSNGNAGAAFSTQLADQAQALCPGIQVYQSSDTDTIRLYRLAIPFELYRLSGLRDWEQQYEAALRNPHSGLHGMGARIETGSDANGTATYRELYPWEKYPSILSYDTDPRTPDPQTGEVCREGMLRRELDSLILEARDLGVLYAAGSGTEGYQIYRVNCDKTRAWDQFSVAGLVAGADGLLPLGRALAEAVAQQHGTTLADMSTVVALKSGGIYDPAHRSATEAHAWEHAARILRAHIPMYLEICSTVERFRAFARDIQVYNQTLLEGMRPSKLCRLIESGVLSDRDGIWMLKRDNGSTQPVFNYAPGMRALVDRLQPREGSMARNGLLAYLLFEKLTAILPGAAFDSQVRFAESEITNLLSAGDVDTLQAYQNAAAFIAQERLALQALGARLDGNPTTAPTAGFRNAMTALAIPESELVKIDVFYFRTV